VDATPKLGPADAVREQGSAPEFAQLLIEGKITDEQCEEWIRSTGKKVLPERVHPKKTEKKTTKRKSA
jgi:hypothetical protein